MVVQYSFNLSSDYLAHHGILGQKWGVRNGPPYPLKRSYGGQYELSTTPSKAKAKRAAKTVASTMGWAALSALGLGMINKAAYASSLYKEYGNFEKKEGNVEKKTELKKQTTKSSTEENLNSVNPYRKKGGGINNCQYCVIGMEMRERGYDVRARRRNSGGGNETLLNAFDFGKNDKIQQVHVEKNKGESNNEHFKRSYNTMMNMLEKQGDGARGYLGISWDAVNGHALFYKVENGRAKIYDPQDPKANIDNTLALAKPDYWTICRLDKLKISDNIGESVISSDKDKK